MPNSIQKKPMESERVAAAVVIDLTKSDNEVKTDAKNDAKDDAKDAKHNAKEDPAASAPTARSTHKEPRGTPAEDTPGMTNRPGITRPKRRSEGGHSGRGVQKQPRIATSPQNTESPGSTIQAHPARQASSSSGNRQTSSSSNPQASSSSGNRQTSSSGNRQASSSSGNRQTSSSGNRQASSSSGNQETVSFRVTMHPDVFKDFPSILARATESDARVQGVFKIRLMIDEGRLSRRVRAERPKSYLKYSHEALGNNLSRVELTYTKDASRIGENDHTAPTDYSSSVLDVIKRQEERLESISVSALRYRAGIPLKSARDRRGMGLLRKSPIHPLDGNRLAQTPRSIDGIHKPRCYETDAGEGTPFVMGLEECNLHLVHLLYVGRRVWICVSPNARRTFELRVRSELARMRDGDDKTSRCGQFARHARLYFRTSVLEEWGIDYTIVDQKAGEVVVTLPGTYHQGFTLGYTKAEAVNYADQDWASSKRLRCDGRCPEYPVDPDDIHSGVVEVRMPEASIRQRGETHQAVEEQLRDENGQQPAIATNIGRSLSPYGGALVRAFQDNTGDLGTMKKAQILQMMMQCEWPGTDDITAGSAAAAKRAELFDSVASFKLVSRRVSRLGLPVGSSPEMIINNGLALEGVSKAHGCSAGDSSRLLMQGVALEHMADMLGLHILLTLPIEDVEAKDFALVLDTGFPDNLLKLPIQPWSYPRLEQDEVEYFVKHFPSLRPDLVDARRLRFKAQELMEILGLKQWVCDEISKG